MDANRAFDELLAGQADGALGSPLPCTTVTSTNQSIPTGSDTMVYTAESLAAQMKSCAGCGGLISERFLLQAVDRFWHVGCLKCSCCQALLGELHTCFTKSGMILCKNDYHRMFASSNGCATCGQNIPPNELVMKTQGKPYHLKCFTCIACHSQLRPGDKYSIINGNLICELDYPKVIKGYIPLPQRGLHKVC